MRHSEAEQHKTFPNDTNQKQTEKLQADKDVLAKSNGSVPEQLTQMKSSIAAKLDTYQKRFAVMPENFDPLLENFITEQKRALERCNDHDSLQYFMTNLDSTEKNLEAHKVQV